MKKSILILTTAFFLFAGTATVLTSCGNEENTDQHEHTDGDMMNDGDGHMNMSDEHSDAETVYACPMHHNITGKKGDKCSICGMDLTSTKDDPVHQGHSH